jgi:hypothetical protein
MNGTKLAEIIEAEASDPRYNTIGHDIDGYAAELVGNAINIPAIADGIVFTSDGYIIEGADAEEQAAAILAENGYSHLEPGAAEVWINEAVWRWMQERPVFFS